MHSARTIHAIKRILQLNVQPLEPQEFCDRWLTVMYPNLKIKRGDYGYKKRATTFLAEMTGQKENTISTWGKDFSKAPTSVKERLRLLDMLYQFGFQMGELIPEDSDFPRR